MGRLLCRIGVHRWQRQTNEEGEAYRRCLRCGRDGDVLSFGDHPGAGPPIVGV